MPLFPRICLAFAAFGWIVATGCAAFTDAPPQPPFPAQESHPVQALINAPDFPKDFAWLNTDQPLSFKGNLKGQVVVMDFWCYCCINCMHVLPELESLQNKYADQPVVILGVHSNKYDNEADPANIRAAIQRYNITHPVLVDQGMKVWNAYDVHAWPTLIVVGADGKIIGQVSGEGHRDLLDKTIARALAAGKERRILADKPLKLAHEGQVRAATGLSFPGKVLADPAGNRMVIVDSNHNRILIATLPDDAAHSTLIDTIGSGSAGADDGDFDKVTFNRPQGAALSGNTLWIADTENHLIRRADLQKKTVTTALGTGRQNFDPDAGKSGREQGLNSPWDLALSGNRLYIANAGQHQLFSMNLMTGMTEILAGTAHEGLADADARDADLAQPSGLAFDPKSQTLYFADSETSSVRALNLKTQTISTLIGHGLFDFGDHDGDRSRALFQHDLGVALSADGSRLFVADTYNHKIKSINLSTGIATTLAGTGKPGAGAPGPGEPLQLFEPASVATVSNDELLIADTNNHRILRLNPNTGAWKEIMIAGLNAPGTQTVSIDANAKDAGSPAFPSGKELRVQFSVPLPAHEHFTPGSPISLKLTDDKQLLYTATLWSPEASDPTAPLTALIPPEALSAKPANLYLTLYYTRCSTGPSAVCTPDHAAWKLTPQFTGSAADQLMLSK